MLATCITFLLVNLYFLHAVPRQEWTDGAQFLYKFQRGIRAVQGDGNCLFSTPLAYKMAISHIL